MSELRWNPTTEEWIITATQRQDRTFFPPPDYNPLAPTKPGGFPTEIPAPTYEIVVFENKFPSLRREPPEPAVEGTDFEPVLPAQGVCEVVCYTPQADTELAKLPVAEGGAADTRLGRPLRDSERVPVRPLRLYFREQGQGDRRHAGASARPDLRLPVHTAHRRAKNSRPPAITKKRRGGIFTTTCCRRKAGRQAHRGGERAFRRRRAVLCPLSVRGAYSRQERPARDCGFR